MIWKFLKQNVLFPKGLNWVQHWVSRLGLLWSRCKNREFKKLRQQLQVKCYSVIPSEARCTKKAKCTFACLGRMFSMYMQRMKDLLLRSRVVVRTSNMKISSCRLAKYVEALLQKVCRRWSTIIFPHSTNQSVDLWCFRCLCRRQILNSVLSSKK